MQTCSSWWAPLFVLTGDVGTRNSQDGARGIYDDTIMLSSTDFLVGTFSSQVSRLAYEIMQVCVLRR